MQTSDRRNIKQRVMIFFLLILTLLCSSGSVFAEANAGSTNGSAGWTNDAYYKENEYMWKVSLFVAKSDTISKDNSTINDFYRIGNDALYIIPDNSPAAVNSIIYTKGDKVKTLQELTSKGNNYSALDPVQFTNGGGVNRIIDTNVPLIPQLCDGISEFDGVSDPNQVGQLPTVKDYFEKKGTINKAIDFYAAQFGTSRAGLVKDLSFTINGESRTGWNPDGILPGNINNNPTNQVEWVLVYEPVGIVYVIGSRQGYALTATDFAVAQIKKQFDWRYNENRMSGWAGQQPDAWDAQENRQHVARMAFLLMGNSVHTVAPWYGFKFGNGVDENATIPYRRWFSDAQIDYGGWGMVRYRTPDKFEDARDNDYRPNTSVVLTAPVFANQDSMPGQQLTVTYKINGDVIGTDEVICPKGTQTMSSLKWETPDVSTRTEYELEISVSPYPYGTVGGDGNEYIKKKIFIKPLKENPPPDPKVGDKEPSEFSLNTSIPDPTANKEDKLQENESPTIKSVNMITQPPIYKGDIIKVQVVTNVATPTLTLTNTDTGEAKAFNATHVGEGILSSREVNRLTNEVIWVFEFLPPNLGTNHYSFTAQNPDLGAGTPLGMAVEVSIDPDLPKIFSIEIDPVKEIYTLFADTKSPPLQFELFFNTDGGTNMASQMVDYNKTIPVPAMPSKDGFTFCGWYKDNNFTEPWDFLSDKIIGVTTLYAKWQINVYTVSFNLSGHGTAVPSQTVIHKDVVIKPPNPEDNGYNFEGWYSDPAFASPWDFDNFAVTSDLMLYAKWTPKKVAVYFEENGGSLVSDLVVDYDTKIAEPVSTRPGYSFEDWYLDSTCTDKWNFAVNTVKNNITLYAKWIPKESIIDFEENGGSEVSKIIGKTDQTITDRSLPTSTKNNYVLEGWYAAADFSGEALTQLPEKFPVDGITFYAKWKLETFRLIDLFPDPGFAETIRLEMNKRDERKTDPIPDIYAEVVTYLDLEYVKDISSVVSLSQLFPDESFAEDVRSEMNKQIARLLNPILSIFDKVITTTDLDYVKEIKIID